MDVWDGDNDRIASLGVDSMKCPKCGSEMEPERDRYGVECWYCPVCTQYQPKRGHEEKVPLVDPWNPYMADDDGEKR
jgi:Zn-finger nucleic acid-binding protein